MGAFDFSGQTVVVTGAGRGIGFAVAEGFAAAGANVAMIATSAQIHEAAARVAESAAGSVRGIVCDITDRRTVRDNRSREPETAAFPCY